MDKKNTLLLTVIAIATLLVAVIGATFAYFTAQAGAGAQANVNVQTHTTDTATFSTFDDIKINATIDNFSNEDGSLRDSTKGYVSFKKSDSGQDTAYYCYNAYIEIDENDFIYSLPKTFGEESHDAHYPELVLNIWKKAKSANGQLSDEESIFTDTELYKKTFIADAQSSKINYFETILAENKVCDMDTVDGQGAGCEDSQKVSGYDITIAGNSAYEEENELKSVTRINIPANMSAESYNADDYVHKITASDAASAVYDLWKVEVTLVNYLDTDIQGSAQGSGDQSKYDYDNNKNIGNAGRKLNATLHFEPLAEQTNCDAQHYNFGE